MGFSFSIDDLIDSGHYDGMNTGWNPVSSSKTRDYFRSSFESERRNLLEKINTFSYAERNHDDAVAKRTSKEIETELTELESMRYYYRIAEKNLLRVKNSGRIQSVVIGEIIKGLLEFYNESCESIAEIQDEIKKHENIKFAAQPKEYSEQAVKKDVAKNIFDIVTSGFVNNLPLSHEMFKSLVKDLECVLEILETNGEKVKKIDVEQYFMNECKRDIGMVICQNCQRPMLADIPYCFNCFDGRYS